uniref:hypothetical protein n=1 Tax=Aliarcobacter sp. TaxID=2321116 RepID=UPI004048C60F
MKNIILYIFVLLYFSACSTLYLNTPQVPQKEELIKKANSGDIKAMLDLSKHYNYAHTVDGLKNYSQWFNLINETKDSKDIYDMAVIYENYEIMFVNGQEKALELYKLAANKNYLKANIAIIKNHLETYNLDFAKNEQNKIIDKMSWENFNELYNIYDSLYRSQEAEELITYMKNKNFELPIAYYKNQIKTLLRKQDDESKQKLEFAINKIIDSKDSENIFEAAKLLNQNYDYARAIFLYEEGLKYDSKKEEILLNLGNLYLRGDKRKGVEVDTKKAYSYFEKAALLGNKEASLKLLREYSRTKDTLNEYFDFVNKLSQTSDGQIQLANYYQSKSMHDKSNKILDSLAENGNKKAIVLLATQKRGSYSYNPENFAISKKWIDYIDKSEDKELQRLFLKEISSYNKKRDFQEEIGKYIKKEGIFDDISFIREIKNTFLYIDKKQRLDFLMIAASTEDKGSILDLAKYYLEQKDDKNIDKALETYQLLINKGDIDTINILARFYLNPPYFAIQREDRKKGLEYYEKASALGNLYATKILAQEYLCGSCGENKNLDYAKAKEYILKLHNLGSTEHTFSLGWMYNFGKGVKQDLLKAKEYYEIAANAGHSKAYYNLGWLYYDDTVHNNVVIKKDYVKALEYFKKAVPYLDATNIIGLFYENGYGVEKNISEAIKYYKSVAKSNEHASINLADYYDSIKNYKEAFIYYENADKLNHSDAAYKLATYYELGRGTKKDINKAIEYYSKSATEKSKKALKKLKEEIR